jgi:hypothetical protein
VRVGSVDEQVRDAMGKRFGFTRTGARDDQQRATVFRLSWSNAVFDRFALFGI